MITTEEIVKVELNSAAIKILLEVRPTTEPHRPVYKQGLEVPEVPDVS
jgi:hypothetical protein